MNLTLQQAIEAIKLHQSMVDETWSELTPQEREYWSAKAAETATKAWNEGKWGEHEMPQM